MTPMVEIMLDQSKGSGSGSSLPVAVLTIAGISTLISVLVSAMSIYFHLKNYLNPHLQRMVIRIMIMVPIYSISSLISIFSLEAAFVVDCIRDVYEAFVIYCFFVLLISYLGGERSLLILLHGRPPKIPVFPANLFRRELDVSDPYTLLALKRGILQYVQIKPVLAIATLILKALGKYNEGDFKPNSGYLWVSIVYNTSICVSLYCLAVFWMCVSDDLKPFRPMPKFLCVKGIIFFSFWQGILISLLVAAGTITHLGPYTDSEHISLGLSDCLICIEMPFFAWAHLYAFSFRDFLDPNRSYVARMPMYYAFRDAFGMKDVVEDSKTTLRGEGMDYRHFEPSEGYMHQGEGRERRIRAGLRYSKGGKAKYWLPQTAETNTKAHLEQSVNGVIHKIPGVGVDYGEVGDVHAPLLEEEEEDVVHLAPDLAHRDSENPDPMVWDVGISERGEEGFELPFGDINDKDEALFEHSRKYLFGDYNYPCIDVSSEYARGKIWDEEERVLRDERGAWFSPIRGARGREHLMQREGPAWEGYGAVGNQPRKDGKGKARGYDDDEPVDRLIDHGSDKVPASGGDGKTDVKLRWTNIKKPAGGGGSRSNSPKVATSSSLSSSGSSGSRPSGSGSRSRKVRSPPNPKPGVSPRQSPVLPPDAVDLIVEDDEAAEEERTRERRKGEPAVGGAALRKVYRRGFVAHDSHGHEAVEGEVEIDEPEVDYVPETQEEAPPKDDDDGLKKLEDEEEALKDANEGGPIARVVTPPIHSQADPHFGEDNPWA